MEFLLLGLIGLAFLKGNSKTVGSLQTDFQNKKVDFQNKNESLPETKKYLDKGDKWSQMYQSLYDLSDIKTISIFKEMMIVVNQFNKINSCNIQIFETRRAMKRQLRLIRIGNSQANPNYAPHPQGRAIDLVNKKGGVWLWDNILLKKLNDYLAKNFKYFYLLRTGRDFKNFVDWPHYEIKRSTWNNWNQKRVA